MPRPLSSRLPTGNAMRQRLGRIAEAREEAHRCLTAGEVTPRERYYRGLTLHLLGVHDSAEQELHASRRDPVVRGWPGYAELVPPRGRH